MLINLCFDKVIYLYDYSGFAALMIIFYYDLLTQKIMENNESLNWLQLNFHINIFINQI